MDNLLVALLAASMSTFGSFLLQMYVSRESRRQTYDEKRLMALLDVRQEVEKAGGKWFGWASARLGGESVEVCDSFEESAGSATNDAWYATRVFEMYFPTMMKESQMMRDAILRRKSEAYRQVALGGDFDAVKMKEASDANLDAIVAKARKSLGYPTK